MVYLRVLQSKHRVGEGFDKLFEGQCSGQYSSYYSLCYSTVLNSSEEGYLEILKFDLQYSKAQFMRGVV